MPEGTLAGEVGAQLLLARAPGPAPERRVVEKLSVGTFDLHYTHAAAETSLATALIDSADGFGLDVSGRLRGEPLHLRLKSTSLGELIKAGSAPLPWELTAHLGDSDIAGSATVAFAPGSIGGLLDLRLPPASGEELAATLPRIVDRLRLGDLRLRYDDPRLDARSNVRLKATDFQSPARIEGNIEYRRKIVNVEVATGALNQVFTDWRSLPIDLDLQFEDTRVEVDTTVGQLFPVEHFSAAVAVEGPTPAEAFAKRSRVLPTATLDLFGVAGGTAAFDLDLKAHSRPWTGKLAGQFDRVGLDRIFGRTDAVDDALGEIGGRITLWVKGESIAEWLGGADGGSYLTIIDGTIDALLLELAGLDFIESLTLFLGNETSSDIACSYADLQVRDGTVTVRPLLIDTTDTKIRGEGTIDLKRERLDLTLRPYPQDVSLLTDYGRCKV